MAGFQAAGRSAVSFAKKQWARSTGSWPQGIECAQPEPKMSVGGPRAGWMRRDIPGDDRRAFDVVQRRGAGRKEIERLGPWPGRGWGEERESMVGPLQSPGREATMTTVMGDSVLARRAGSTACL